jgi:hypothetical protein
MISDISVQSIFSGNSIDSDNAQKFWFVKSTTLTEMLK